MKTIGKLLCAAAVTAACATPALAQDSREIKVSFVFGQTHWLWEHGGGIFAAKAEEATAGKVRFTPFPAGQLGKQTAGAVMSGVADTGIVVPSYEADKLPLTSVSELPGIHGNACEGTAKLWEIAREGGPLYEQELKPLGLRALYVNVLPPYRIFTTRKQVTSFADLAGLKLRANGAAMNKAAQALGTVAVTVPSPEMFDSLTRGTVDGTFYPAFSVKTDKLEGVLNYGVNGPKLGGGSTMYVIKESVWQSLDAETQAKLTQAGLETQQYLCNWNDQSDAEITKELSDAGHIKFTTLSEEENARWNAAVDVVIQQWESDLAKVGRDGTSLVAAFRAAPGHF